MKHLEVTFTLQLGGTDHLISVSSHNDDFYVSVNNSDSHLVQRTPRYWKTESRQIFMYINEIRKSYRDIIRNLKWDLPENLKAVIYFVKLDTKLPGIRMMLEYDVDAMAFHELLSRHLVSMHIKPVMPVQIYDARNSRLIDLRLNLKGSKGHFPVVSPITQKEVEEIFWPTRKSKR